MIVAIAPVETALLVSKVMPYAVAALLIVWTQAYGKRARRRGERLTAAVLSAEPDRTPELQEVAASPARLRAVGTRGALPDTARPYRS